jgi:hypothetical protein
MQGKEQPGVFEAMAKSLTGESGAQHDPVCQAAMIRSVAALLRSFPDEPSAQWMASGFETWLQNGGDLQATLGLRPRQGGAYETPQKALALAARNDALRKLATAVNEPDKAKAIAEMVKRRDPKVLVLHQCHGELPASKAQIARILRAGPQ